VTDPQKLEVGIVLAVHVIPSDEDAAAVLLERMVTKIELP
jgi:hypothetical protein